MFLIKLLILIALFVAAIIRGVMRFDDDKPINTVKTAAAWLCVIAVIFAALSGVGQVPTGTRGVVLRFGSVTGRTLGEGIYVVTPMIDDVQMMDVRTRAFHADADAASKDLQNVHTQITLNYSLSPDRVGEVFRTLGVEYENRIIVPAVQEGVKSSTALYDAENLIVERPAVKDSIERYLRGRLSTHGITLDTVSITGFTFSPEFSQAIERKVTATQEALTEQNNLQAVKFRADQAIATANGEAESIRVKATALRESPAVLQLNAINKWNGVLPTYMGSGPLPFLSVK